MDVHAIPFKAYRLMEPGNVKKKKGLNFFFVIIAAILGSALWKQFDFEAFSFDKPALAALYAIVFVASIYFLIRDYRSRPEQ